MSAALVESVRDTVDAEESVEIHRVHGTPGVPPLALISRAQMLRAKLDLPAILAALTEAEALRAQVAAGQAREVALRKLAAYMAEDVCQCDENLGTQCASCFARDYLSAPTDTAALRAFGERCVLAGWVGGNNYAFPDEPEELVVADIPPDAQQQIAAIVDRVLGGS